MTLRSGSKALLVGICVTAAAVTVLTHLVYLPQYVPARFTRGLPYLALGWVSYGLVFYSLARLRPVESVGGMPTMRAADTGIALFLFSVVLSGLLDTAGLTLAEAGAFHVLPAVGVYLGLALAGWGFGTRTRTVNEIAAEGT